MSSRSPHVEIYVSEELRDGRYVYGWRWRFRSSNGKILSQSSEAYQDPRDLVRGLELSHPGYRMLDGTRSLDAYGGWYLWPTAGQSVTLAFLIPVRVPEGTVKLWRSRRNR